MLYTPPCKSQAVVCRGGACAEPHSILFHNLPGTKLLSASYVLTASGQVHVTSISPPDHSMSSTLSRFKDGKQKGRGVEQCSAITEPRVAGPEPEPGPTKPWLMPCQHITVSLSLVSTIPGWSSGDRQKANLLPNHEQVETGPIYLDDWQRAGFRDTNQRQGQLILWQYTC